MLGLATMDPDFIRLADFIDKTFNVKTINIIYDTIDKGQHPRHQVKRLAYLYYKKHEARPSPMTQIAGILYHDWLTGQQSRIMTWRAMMLGTLLIFSFPSFSQKADLSGHLKLLVSQMNLEFNPPRNLIEKKAPNIFYAPRSNSGYLDGAFYALAPREDDVLITVSLLDAGPLLANPSKHNYNDTSHIVKINYLIDTRPLYFEKNGQQKIIRASTLSSGKRIKLYKGRKLTAYGADDAGIIIIPTDNPYLEKYNKLKVFFMYKRGVGEVYIQYFYNEGTNIDKYIKMTKKMLRFN